MLPKIWKKVLLAICIVACLFNVISKIVNRHSLEFNLKSVNDGNTIWDSIKTKNEVTTSDKIDGVIESSSNTSNTSDTANIVSDNTAKNTEITDADEKLKDEEETKEEKGNEIFNYSNFFNFLIKDDE